MPCSQDDSLDDAVSRYKQLPTIPIDNVAESLLATNRLSLIDNLILKVILLSF
jgi:hypothetical protein